MCIRDRRKSACVLSCRMPDLSPVLHEGTPHHMTCCLLLNTSRQRRPNRGRDRLQQRPDPLENGERLRRIDTMVRDADHRRHGFYEDAHDVVVAVGQMHDCWIDPTVRVEEDVYTAGLFYRSPDLDVGESNRLGQDDGHGPGPVSYSHL